MQQRLGPLSPNLGQGWGGFGFAVALWCPSWGAVSPPFWYPTNAGAFGAAIGPQPRSFIPVGRLLLKLLHVHPEMPWGSSPLRSISSVLSEDVSPKPLLRAQQQLVAGWGEPKQVIISIMRPPVSFHKSCCPASAPQLYAAIPAPSMWGN